MEASANGLRKMVEESRVRYSEEQSLENHINLTASLQQYITFESIKRYKYLFNLYFVHEKETATLGALGTQFSLGTL